MAQNHVLSYVSCWVGRSTHMIGSCESSLNEDAKIGIGFVSWDLQLTTHQWIQGYLRKAFCWFSLEVFELEISPIPIFASSFQGLSDEQLKFSLQSTQQLTLDKTWFWAIYLTDYKTFLPFKKFGKKFQQNLFL